MTRMDYAVVALFLACMALIGIVIGRRIQGLEDYFAAGRRMPAVNRPAPAPGRR